MLRGIVLALFFCCAAAVARAEPAKLMLTNPDQAGVPGSLIIYRGIITNPNPVEVFVEPVAIGAPNLGIHDDIFFLFFGSLVGPGESTAELDLFGFRLNLKYTGPFPASFEGTFSIVTSGEGFQTDFNFFRLGIVAPPQAVPEPASLFLLGTGLAAAVAAARRRVIRRSGRD